MPVLIEMHNTGDSSECGEIAAMIEHVLSDRPGDWGVFILGSRESADWEMKVEGPKGFERSSTLIGSRREAWAVRDLPLKLLSSA